MKNELFDEFKRRVAISNFEEEYEKRRKQEMKKLKIANVAAVLAVAVVQKNRMENMRTFRNGKIRMAHCCGAQIADGSSSKRQAFP